jgi:hypothetical protein
MPRDAKGNPRSGHGRAKYADAAHEESEKEEKKEEKQLNGDMHGEKEKPAKKGMEDSEDEAAKRGEGEGEGGQEDEGDIADVTEMHGPANHLEMDMDHAAGKHTVTSMHGEKRHKKVYTDPTMAIRHAHVAAGMGEPQMPQQQDASAGGAAPMSTMDMMKGIGGGGMGGM